MNVDLSGARWFKSVRSGTGGECVEVAHLPTAHVAVRDSKNPTGPALIFTPTAWDAFLTRTRAARMG
ncbi:DUF397 domain-containing protein [Nocardia cyriacigeorgica]|uniref:DUF397 domain-containing protein n=1 Tax=Nocardia cyriacigeorgica TaxID=135487 RepID=A0A5R8NY96_9NOCA|nr:DUF397 domain-containing protein [Nocardia cyriacigeorgica]TLF81130.1 DUF397 domain-containing protein [Nocardia cyriacigeorgica]